jgi:Fur family ferric uptake transcriptional regulator
MPPATTQSESWGSRAQRVLAENGRRSGQARRALVEMLDAQTCARSVIEIEAQLSAGKRPVARASIYRILDELEQLGLVRRVDIGQEMARYEAVRGGDGHHHHLVCDSCGSVTPFTDDALEDAIRELSRRVPIRVSEHEITLHGDCRACTTG